MQKVSRDVLRQLNDAKGKLDSDSGQIFTGFVGRFHMDDRLFQGELTFREPGEIPPPCTVSIQSILGVDLPSKPTRQAKPKKSAQPESTTDKRK